MSEFLSLLAIALSIVALSKISTVSYKITELEKRLQDSKKPETQQNQTQAQQPQQEPAPQPIAQVQEETQPQPVEIVTQQNQTKKPLSVAQVFSWTGGVLLVLGALFTFSYMMQKGYITIGLILSLAALVGVLLTAVGVIIKDEKLQTTASTLCAAGISICFLTIYSAYAFFGLMPAEMAFALMAVTAFSSFIVSAFKNKQYISFLALAAAFLTPILLSSGQDKYIFFFTYLALVNISAAALSIRKGWSALLITSLSLTFICQLTYDFKDNYRYVIYTIYAILAASTAIVNKDKVKNIIFKTLGIFTALQIIALCACITSYNMPYIFAASVLVTLLVFAFELIHKTGKVLPVTIISWAFLYICYLLKFTTDPIAGYAALGVFAMFYIYPFIFNKHFQDGSSPWLSAAAISVAAFMPVYTNLGKVYFNDALGLIPLFFALCYLVPGATFLYNKENYKKASSVFIAAAVIFTALIFPIQFTAKWLTILLALYATALVWLNNKIENRVFIPLAQIIFAVVFLRLIANPFLFDYCASEVKIFNWYMLVFGISAAAMLISSRFCNDKNYNFKALLKAGAAFLLFALMNIEIADYFADGGRLQFDFSGEFAEAVTYTLAWAAYGAIACIVSFFNKSKLLVKCGILIICASVVKLALIDLWKLDTLYRIFGVFGMAVVLIAVAFLFQKFNKKTE